MEVRKSTCLLIVGCGELLTSAAAKAPLSTSTAATPSPLVALCDPPPPIGTVDFLARRPSIRRQERAATRGERIQCLTFGASVRSSRVGRILSAAVSRDWSRLSTVPIGRRGLTRNICTNACYTGLEAGEGSRIGIWHIKVVIRIMELQGVVVPRMQETAAHVNHVNAAVAINRETPVVGCAWAILLDALSGHVATLAPQPRMVDRAGR